MTYNHISEDRIVKTSINIPIPLMVAARKRMRTLELEYFVTYVRILIKRDTEGQHSMSLSEFLQEEKRQQSQQELFQEFRNPAKKYPGFVAGMLKSTFVNKWFNKIKKSG